MTSEEIKQHLPESIINQVHESIGQASMCWENIEAAGVFKTTMAIKIAEELLSVIAEYKIFALKMEESFKAQKA